MNNKLLKRFAQETLMLNEEILRGLPDFVMDDAAIEATDYLRKALIKSINRRVSSAGERRIQIKIVNDNLKDLQEEMHEMIREKLHKITYEL